MHKLAIFFSLIIGMLIIFSPEPARTQETDVPIGEDHSYVIEEALDEAEENINHVEDEEVFVELEPATLKNIESVLELESGPDIETKIIPLLHTEPSGIIDALNQMKSKFGEVSFSEEDHTLILKDAHEQLEAMSVYVKAVDILLETKTFILKYAKAQEIVDKVRGLLTENVGNVETDETANSLVATDTPLKIGEISELITMLDRVDKEIMINSKILQIVLNDEHIDGVDWEAIVSDYQSMVFQGFFASTNTEADNRLDIGTVSG